jgi:fumarate reductase flavoprotein subunit
VEERESEFRGTLTKRTFLSALGAMGLVSAVGIRSSWADGTYAVSPYVVDPNVIYDVIAVGCGTAGLPLAMCAGQRGKVLVIDRGDDIGGTLFSTGGLMSAAGTNLQKRHGIHDTPDMHYEETMEMGHGKANPEILRLYVDNAADAINWLEDLGVKWRPQDPSLGNHAIFKTRRYHGGAEAGMSILKALLPAFIKAEAAGRIRVLLRTSVVELTQQRDGAIDGVIAQGADGRRVQYKARSIVLTSGGYMRSPALFKKYHDKTLFTRVTYAHSLGHGLELGASVGAGISGKDLYIAHRGAVLEDRDYPSPVLTTAVMDPDRRLPWEVEVNNLGERYVAEDADINTLERALTNQVDMAAWLIWDQDIYDKAPALMPRLPKEEQMKRFTKGHPMFARADSIEELARRMNLPSQKLAETIKAYNQAVASQSDPLGRKHLPLPIVKPPFYAVETHGTSVFGYAGVDVDRQLRVVTPEKRPIGNLYAAGEVIGGWQCAGDVVVNGCMVTPAVTFGKLLGHRMLSI